MKQTRLIMGLPITVEIVDQSVEKNTFSKVFAYFKKVDNRFSTYKRESEISKINRGEIREEDYSADMKLIFEQAEKTKRETNGFFDIKHFGKLDPSGIVKGWAIQNAADLLTSEGYKTFYVEAGGDIQVAGKNEEGKAWTVGIRNPFERNEIVKVVTLQNNAVATSGTSVRGQHIYNPHAPSEKINDVVSLTVIGPNIFDADRFATAAFAMGKQGVNFIGKLAGFEAYQIDKDGIATFTSGFERFVS